MSETFLNYYKKEGRGKVSVTAFGRGDGRLWTKRCKKAVRGLKKDWLFFNTFSLMMSIKH